MVKQKKVYIYGKHAVGEALKHAPHIVRRVEMSPQMQDKKLLELIRLSGVETATLDPKKITSQVEGNAPHQGIIALVSLPGLLTPFEKFYESFTPAIDSALVYLSEIQDPHNVGAIIRSAVAFGATAILLPSHNQAPITGAVIKASAGTAFRIPIVQIENVQQAISQLKKKGVRVYGLAGEAAQSIESAALASPTMFVFGNEGEGIAPHVRAVCDEFVSIPIDARAESLNVAATAAVTLYAWKNRKK
ncbi:MAG TPA: 23S rRNA (guanosine(2251)-2'-O)-methyltransferase RlmB [Candidatus Paceibacterota bacterium]|nr:23S rRNA (guanosine(2251)-2'-O)-methyltransferase RlmB [Candidatus Paceibacterota bacterium]